MIYIHIDKSVSSTSSQSRDALWEISDQFEKMLVNLKSGFIKSKTTRRDSPTSEEIVALGRSITTLHYELQEAFGSEIRTGWWSDGSIYKVWGRLSDYDDLKTLSDDEICNQLYAKVVPYLHLSTGLLKQKLINQDFPGENSKTEYFFPQDLAYAPYRNSTQKGPGLSITLYPREFSIVNTTIVEKNLPSVPRISRNQALDIVTKYCGPISKYSFENIGPFYVPLYQGYSLTNQRIDDSYMEIRVRDSSFKLAWVIRSDRGMTNTYGAACVNALTGKILKTYSSQEVNQF